MAQGGSPHGRATPKREASEGELSSNGPMTLDDAVELFRTQRVEMIEIGEELLAGGYECDEKIVNQVIEFEQEYLGRLDTVMSADELIAIMKRYRQERDAILEARRRGGLQ
jgi:hypothetical protein